MTRTKLALANVAFLVFSLFSLPAHAGYTTLKSVCADDSEQIIKQKFIESRPDLVNADAQTQKLVWKHSLAKSVRFHLIFSDFPYHIEEKVTVKNYLDVAKNKPVFASYLGYPATGIHSFSFTTVDGENIDTELFVTGTEGLCVVKVDQLL